MEKNVVIVSSMVLNLEEKKNLEVFMNAFHLECLIKKPTCFQHSSPSWIDLTLTNKKKFF